MFTRKEQLIAKTGVDGVGRRDYLKQLVEEYQTTKSYENKRQVLANLANFAYDPINYDFIRELKIIDLFLEELSGNQEELSHFALAGLCNLSSDPLNRDYIIKNNGVSLISRQLLHKHEEIALNSLTTLIFLITNESQPSITTPEIINKVLRYQSHQNPRFKNLGSIFLEGYCTEEQIECAKKFNLNTYDIPIPK